MNNFKVGDYVTWFGASRCKGYVERILEVDVQTLDGHILDHKGDLVVRCTAPNFFGPGAGSAFVTLSPDSVELVADYDSAALVLPT